MSDLIKPEIGDKIIDASPVETTLLTDQQVKEYIKVREGIALAIASVLTLSPEDVEAAGFNEKDIERLKQLEEEYERAGDFIPAAVRLVMLLTHTQIDRGHKISILLGELAQQARRRGRRAPNGERILGVLRDLLDYQYGPAERAAATKLKAKKAAAAKEAAAKEAAAKEAAAKEAAAKEAAAKEAAAKEAAAKEAAAKEAAARPTAS